MTLDDKQLLAALDQLKVDALLSGKSLLADMGDYFVRKTRKQAWAVAPTRQQLDDLGRALGNRIKRKPGWSVQREIARRKRARGTFSRGWYVYGSEDAGTVLMYSEKNRVPYAGKVESRVDTVGAAVRASQAKFQQKLRATAQKITRRMP